MITIIMTTYNGEKYVSKQLDSLLSQTMIDNISILIFDDLSTDETFLILKKYEEKYPSIIKAVQNNENSGGTKYNFLNAMIKTTDKYIMLCDQDDVWHKDKVEKTYKIMRMEESIYGKDIPILVHTDLNVVDEYLNIINSSFKEAMNANYEKTSFNNQIIQNTLTGCTAMYNLALKNLITKMPDYCVMHDWWIMLVASAFGKIKPLYDQTMFYRQHGKNIIGAKDVRKLSYKFKKVFDKQGIKKAISETYLQAQAFLNMYHNNLEKKDIDFLENYIKIPHLNKLGRLKAIFKLKTLKNGFARNLGYFAYI